jgi:hypothetical protein
MRARTVTALVPLLDDSLVPEAYDTIRAVDAPISRARGIAALAPRLTESTLLAELAWAREETDPVVRGRALSAVVPVLAEGIKQFAARQALDCASYEGVPRAEMLAAIAPWLPRTRRLRLLVDALDSLAAEGPDVVYAATQHMLVAIARVGYVAEALERARDLESTSVKARALATLALELPGDVASIVATEVFRVINSSDTPEQFVDEFVTIAHLLHEHTRSDYAHILHARVGREFGGVLRAQHQAKLCPLLPLDEQQAALDDVLSTLQTIDDRLEMTALIAGVPLVVSRLGDPTQAIECALRIRDASARRDALVDLARDLPSEYLAAASRRPRGTGPAPRG